MKKLKILLGIVILTILSSFVSAQTFPIGAYSFEEGTGNISADLIGNNTMNIIDAVFVSSKGGNGTGNFALSFDGAVDNANVGQDAFSFDSNESFSLSFWFNSSNGGTILGKREGGNSPGYSVGINIGGDLEVHLRNSNANRIEVETTSIINNGDWKHIVITYSGNLSASGVKVYINSTEQNLVTVTDGLTLSILTTSSFGVGAFENGSNDLYSGSVDEIGIYDKELNQSEIIEIFNNGMEVPNIFAPNVNILFPQPNEGFIQNVTFPIVVEVIDVSPISDVIATIILPNTTIEILVLFPIGGDNFSNNFTTTIEGIYNFTIFANDTFNNINNSESTFINVSTAQVIIVSPLNNSVINASQIDFNISITAGATGVNCELFRNNTIVDIVTGINTSNPVIMVDNVSNITESQTFEYKVRCFRFGEANSTTIFINIDRVEPTINFINPNIPNSLLVNGDNLNSNCEDSNLFEFEGQVIHDSTQTVIHNFSFLNLTGLTNITFSTLLNTSFSGSHTFNVNCSDGHTANDITSLTTEIIANGIIYNYNNEQLTEAYLSGDMNLNKIEIERKFDRVISKLYFDTTKNLSYYKVTKQLSCSVPFKEVGDSGFRDHLICGKMWYDSEDSDTSSYTVLKKINDYIYNIDIFTKNKYLFTNSVGIANTNTQSIQFNVDLQPPNITFITPDNSDFFKNTLFDIQYRPSDILTNVTTCSLFTDVSGSRQLDQTDNTILNNQTNIFSLSVSPIGTFSYDIECTDFSGNTGVSNNQTFNIAVDEFTTADAIQQTNRILLILLFWFIWLTLIIFSFKFQERSLLFLSALLGISISITTITSFGFGFMILTVIGINLILIFMAFSMDRNVTRNR